MEMRLGEKLLSLLLQYGLQQRGDITNETKCVILRRLEDVIALILSGLPLTTTPTTEHRTSSFKLPSVTSSERIVVRLSCARLQKLFNKKDNRYLHLLDAVFADCSDALPTANTTATNTTTTPTNTTLTATTAH